MLYDVITAGGGLAGAALAKSLAEHGYRVVVLERENCFRDRVRREQMHPWGVAEARALGFYDQLAKIGGHQTRWWHTTEVTGLKRPEVLRSAPGLAARALPFGDVG
jgi:2-polyprenyl-6-methoxyphenol hydroxylase-like FAD-dependent oxidoreductase